MLFRSNIVRSELRIYFRLSVHAVGNDYGHMFASDITDRDVYKRQNLTYTSDIKEALTGASYIVSSGGAARKAGMTLSLIHILKASLVAILF